MNSKRDITPQPDEMLLQGYCNGDLACFETLYQRHKQPLFAFIYHQADDRLSSIALFQNTWSSIISGAASVVEQASFTVCLYRIARDNIIDTKRRLAGVGEACAGQQVLHKEDSLVAGMMQNQPIAPLLNACLAQTNPKHVECLLLTELAGLRVQDIAQVIDSTVDATKSRVSNAYRIVAQCVEKMYSTSALKQEHNDGAQQKLVASWFQQLDVTRPDAHLDDRIVAMAGTQLAQGWVGQPLTAQKHTLVRHWRKWQWPAGLMVTVGFIGLILYAHLTMFDSQLQPKETDTVERRQIPPLPDNTNEVGEAALARIEGLSESQAQNVHNAPQATIPQMTDYKALAEAEMLAFRAQNQKVIEQQLGQEVMPTGFTDGDQGAALPLQLGPEPFEEIAGQGIGREKTPPQEDSTAEQYQNRQPPSKAPVQPVFLQRLYRRYELLNSANQSLAVASDHLEVEDVRESIYQYLLQLALLKPDAKIEQKYLNVLTLQQHQELQEQRNNKSGGVDDN